MATKVCAVYDQAIEAFGIPFFVRAPGEAIRSFTDAVNGKEGPMAVHSGDFVLYDIGVYEEGTGLLIPCDPPKVLVRGSDAKSSE